MVNKKKEQEKSLEPVLVGGMVMDFRGQPLKTLEPGTSNPGNLEQFPGGVCRNIMENLFRLGIDPFLISAVGEDLTAKALLEHTHSLQVNTTGIYQLKNHSTATYLAILDQKGDLCTAIADMSIFDQLTPKRVFAHKKKLTKAPIVIMDTNLPQKTLTVLAKFCQQQKIPLWVEPVSVEKSKKIVGLFQYITYLSPNIQELTALTNRKIDNFSDIQTAGIILLEAGVQQLLITLGKDGIILGNHLGFTHFPAQKADVLDVTGAGDALVAGIIYGLLQSQDLRSAIKAGLTLAKLTLQTKETVLSVLNADLLENSLLEVDKNE